MPAASVVIVNYRSTGVLRRCLAALREQTFDDFEVIIADNASDDPDFAALAEAETDPRIRYMTNAENLGFAGGVNGAAAHATGRWLVVLNPDAFPEPGWLAALVETADTDPAPTMVASVQLSDADDGRLDGAGDRYAAFGLAWRGGFGKARPGLRRGPVFSPCGAAALYDHGAFVSTGGYCERYFCYFEDSDLAFRLRLTGGTCVLAPDAIVRHIGGASSSNDAFAVRHGTRNMIWTFVRCMPGPLFALLLLPHIAFVAAYVLLQATRLQIIPALQGIGEALAGLPATWRERREIQRDRTISSAAVARAVTWNPIAAMRRAPAPGVLD